MPKERLQKIMAQADIGSRRKCEDIIRQGRVRVNGEVIKIGAKADPETDTIIVDGETITLENRTKLYIVVNKPKGVLSTNKAPEGDKRPTIRDLVEVPGHLFTIGRLDADSEGMMILTNDGEVTNKVSHPRYEHTKTYKVTVKGRVTKETINKWETGIWLDNSRTAACSVKVLESGRHSSILRIVMVEGRKRQIRRIATIMGHPVIRLVRTYIGQLGLGTLRKGAWYQLDDFEVGVMMTPDDEIKEIRRKRRARKKKKQR